MAPETASFNPLFSEKSDIFSLGMVLWEIVAREIPFSHVAQNDLIPMLIKYEKVRPDIRTNCPPPLAELMSQCWSDSPNDRPTARQVKEKISAVAPPLSPSSPTSLSLPSSAKLSVPKSVIFLNIMYLLFIFSEYFDVNRVELLASVSTERIRTLTSPPPFPQKGSSPPFPLPSSIDIVTLLPPPVDANPRHTF